MERGADKIWYSIASSFIAIDRKFLKLKIWTYFTKQLIVKIAVVFEGF